MMIANAFYLMIWIAGMCACHAKAAVTLLRSNVVPSVPLEEFNALYDLYNNTSGENWSWDDVSHGLSWNFTNLHANPCLDRWQGIECILLNDLYYIWSLKLPEYHLVGTLSDSLGVFSRLEVLDLSGNTISGSIPLAIGDLRNLQYLDFADNPFTGSLPASIGNLTNLISLSVFNTQVGGSIPITLRRCGKLELLYLFNSSFTGTLPQAVFSNLLSLSYCLMENNAFNGSIPPALLNSDSLVFLNLSTNRLSGAIPPSFGLIVLLDLGENKLTGTLEGLEYLNRLVYFDAHDNQLSGSVPATLVTAQSLLSALILSNNQLTGPLPSTLWELSNLVYVDVESNGLSGTLPHSLCAAHKLYNLHLGNNNFQGQLPTCIGNCSALRFINVIRNHISGTLPSSLGELSALQFLYLSRNTVTGTIPFSLTDLPVVYFIYMEFNCISGTLPSVIDGWRQLSVFNIYANMISGTLPVALSQLSNLAGFVAGHNRLHGTLSPLLNHTIQARLSLIDIDKNQFSGALPSELFLLPLIAVTAVENCFTGTLPRTICGCTTLRTLSLDGLSSALACRTKLLSFSEAYTVQHSLRGTIPTCLFALPELTVLHLSGNGLTGTLPSTLSNYDTSNTTSHMNPYLLDVSLSHNQLSGTIPLMFQRKKWFNLDLSYNRISGTLSAEFGSENVSANFLSELSTNLGIDVPNTGYSESALSLEDNRISGRVPQILQNKLNISILGTNMFSCNARATNLPQHDDGLDRYDCGSDSFNYPYYVWLGLAGVCIACIAYIGSVASSCSLVDNLSRWSTSLKCSSVASTAPSLMKVIQLADALVRVAVYITLAILVVLLPIYTILSYFYGTTVHQYAWVTSVAFLTGVVPFIVVLIALLFLIAGVVLLYKLHTADLKSSVGKYSSESELSWLIVLCVYMTFISFNLLFVVGANIAYVYVVMYHTNKLLLIAQLLLSCFKLLWNRFISIYAIRYVTTIIQPNEERDGRTTYTSLQVFVALLNNIAVPCCVVAVISPNCFYNVFVASPAVVSRLVFDTCTEIDAKGACIAHEAAMRSVTYDPPFTYSYQCSSSIVTSYGPAFVILCIVRTFATPLLQFVLFALYCKAPPGTWYHRALSAITIPILKPIAEGGVVTSSVYQPYFDANQLLLSLTTYLGILLTFGAVFPPLAVALLLTLFSVLYTTKAKLGRFLSSAVELQQMQYINTVESECKSSGIDTIVTRSVWMLITASCWFYTLFLFDTLGDAVGFSGAYWVLIVVPLVPVVLYACSSVGECMLQRKIEDNEEKGLSMATYTSSIDTVNILHPGSSSAV